MSEFPMLPTAQQISPAGYLRDVRAALDVTESAPQELNEDGSYAGPDEPFNVTESAPQDPYEDGSHAGPDAPFVFTKNSTPTSQLLDLKHEQLLRKYEELTEKVDALLPRIDTIGGHTQWLVTQLQGMMGAMKSNPMMRGMFNKMGGGQ